MDIKQESYILNRVEEHAILGLEEAVNPNCTTYLNSVYCDSKEGEIYRLDMLMFVTKLQN